MYLRDLATSLTKEQLIELVSYSLIHLEQQNVTDENEYAKGVRALLHETDFIEQIDKKVDELCAKENLPLRKVFVPHKTRTWSKHQIVDCMFDAFCWSDDEEGDVFDALIEEDATYLKSIIEDELSDDMCQRFVNEEYNGLEDCADGLEDVRIVLGSHCPTIINLNDYYEVPDVQRMFSLLHAELPNGNHINMFRPKQNMEHYFDDEFTHSVWDKQYNELIKQINFVVSNFDSLILCNV